MTAKRYHKLAYSQMARLMQGNPKAGQVLKNLRTATPVWGTTHLAMGSHRTYTINSYQDAWDMLREVVFSTMPYNTGIELPRR